MKDIVANRGRIRPLDKVRLLRLALSDNGVRWTLLMGAYYATSAVAERSFAAAHALRRRRDLPGMNSLRMNRQIWEGWDWSAEGEEWTVSPEWKQSVIDTILRPNIPMGSDILEIGPGAGRWTAELLPRARRLVGIDISEAAIGACRERFRDAEHLELRIGNGRDLGGVTDGSVDAIWSFDVFVHINRRELRTYLPEMARVLRPGGVGIIQHGAVGGAKGGWRSDVTADDVRDLTVAAGLDVISQFTSWTGDGREYPAGLYGDAITILKRPGAVRAAA
jgi:SAM-dependent methyltransferase